MAHRSMWASAPICQPDSTRGYGNISPKNCFKGGQETNCRLNNLLCAALLASQRISLWFFQTRDYKTVELTLRGALRLTWNRI